MIRKCHLLSQCNKGPRHKLYIYIYLNHEDLVIDVGKSLHICVDIAKRKCRHTFGLSVMN